MAKRGRQAKSVVQEWSAAGVAKHVGGTAARVRERWGDPVDVWRILRESWERGDPIIARTYRELAEKLGMSCADPERTLKQYVTRGMPGHAGRTNRKDGRFDVEVCAQWIAANVRGTSAARGELSERILQLDLEIKERQKLAQLERLVDVDEVSAFLATCVANSRAILEAIADEVLAQLEGVDEARRKSIHTKVTVLVDTAFEELARLNEGDTDPTEEDGAPVGAREVS